MLNQLRKRHEWSEMRTLEKGFTLVELLVVIVILGILAAVVVFAVNGISDRGQLSACKTDSSTLRSAVEAYRAQNGPNDNPTQAQLVSSGLLNDTSTLHTISYAGTTLNLTPAGNCVAEAGNYRP